MTAPDSSRGTGFHRFAWDGFSFDVPSDWNLSYYWFDAKLSTVRLEDDESICLDMEWTPRRPVDTSRVRERYGKSASALTEAAQETQPVDGLPAGWSAFMYIMPDKRVLITAFWLAPASEVFLFLRLHFDQTGRTRPLNVLKRLAQSFAFARSGAVPWAIYDVAFDMDREFRLTSTKLQAGSKLMVFEWKLRRFFVWQFSLASVVLKDTTLAHWSAAFLNTAKDLKGALFSAAGDEQLAVRRRPRYALGQYDEIGRWCFRYAAGCARLPATDSILLAVYHYRGRADLAQLRAFEKSTPLVLRGVDAGAPL